MADFTAASPVTPTTINDAIALCDTSGNDRVFVPAETVNVVDAVRINVDKPIQLISLGQTTIVDDCSGNREVMVAATYPGKVTRISGFKFVNGARAEMNFQGAIKIYGTPTEDGYLVFDHNEFDHLFAIGMIVHGLRGVISDCTFLFDGTSIPIYFRGHEINAPWNGYGDAEYAAASDFGTNKFLFVEDCIFTYDDGVTIGYAATDAINGARFVVRYCALTRCHVEMHGTESAGRFRGTRAGEFYESTVIGPIQGSYVLNVRSGVALAHHLTATELVDSPGQIHLTTHRLINSFPTWGISDGTNVWDVNVAGGPFYSGTASSAGSLTVTVAGAGWTVNQWANHSIKKLTVGVGASYIVSNTSDTITFNDNGGYPGGNLTFTADDTFEIHKVDMSIDQPGRVGGSLISDETPSPPVGWNDQTTEACYSWNNTANGSALDMAGAFATIREDEHYFNATEKPGYTPYTYPHPLREGTDIPDEAPTLVAAPIETADAVVGGTWTTDEGTVSGSPTPTLTITIHECSGPG